VRYYSVDHAWNVEPIKTSSAIRIDKQGPTFMFNNNSWGECAIWTLTITNASDIGVWLHANPYSFDGSNWLTTSSLDITGQQSWAVTITWYVRDALENLTIHTATYTFNDSVPTANNFTGHANVWSGTRTVNWKLLSNATDGACWSWDISFDSIVSTWTKWICSVSGDNIIYTPNTGAVGSDYCEISIQDNDGNKINIIVSWWGISYIWWSPSWWGWWYMIKDNCCINWGLPWWNHLCIDHSDSYYDWTCEKWSYKSTDVCGVNQSNYSDELKLAYLYSYNYGITTMCPIQTANLDGHLYRNHLAKMISEYAVNVLWKKPNVWKKWCDKFQDIGKETQELKDFMKTACELNLMWLHADWQTPKDNFDPNDIVTRAEFGTVFSRLLFGDMYNIKDESSVYKNEWYWYKDHLNALKSHWVMTQVDWDRPKYREKRGWVMLMMMRADKFWLFAGKVPALMWIKSLFN
jgi:hypothetical protein